MLTDLDVPRLIEESFVFLASDVAVDHLPLHQLELLYAAYINIHLPAYDRIFRLLIRYSRSLSWLIIAPWTRVSRILILLSAVSTNSLIFLEVI